MAGQETDEYLSLVVTADGKYVATGSGNDLKGINLWDYAQGKHLFTIKKDGNVDIFDNIDLFPDGKKVLFLENTKPISSFKNKFTIYILDIETRETKVLYSIQDSNCDKFKVSRSGNFIVNAFRGYTSENMWNHSLLQIDLSDLKKLKSFINERAINSGKSHFN